MIETWHQWTCDGCGHTECLSGPNMTRAEVRREMVEVYGMKSYGRLDYCRACVAEGIHKTRRSIFGSQPSS